MTIFVQQLNLGGTGPRVAIKDTIDIAGYPTKGGSRSLDDAPTAARNADVVQRALDAGCQIIGKANLHELAFGVTGINRWTGTAPNPKYPDLIPGGSSSGSAAAVAAGLADFALGTDTGGSIRIPAACCGIYGLKPTFGRVSRRGVLPAETSLDCVGPFAPDIDMLIAAMRVIDGSFAEPRESAGRVALIDVMAEPEITATVRAAIENVGLEISHTRLDGMESAFEAGLTIINAETWAAFGHLVKTGFVGEDVSTRLLRAAETSTDDVAAAETVRRAFTDAVDQALEHVDALILPTMPEFPATVEDAMAGKASVRITSLVRPFNLSGHPALSIPLRSAGNLPVGLQLVGRKGSDEGLCGLARQIAIKLNACDIPMWRT
jgi:amidase